MGAVRIEVRDRRGDLIRSFGPFEEDGADHRRAKSACLQDAYLHNRSRVPSDTVGGRTAAMWKEIDKARFWEMLEILPPAVQTGSGFLVGEAWRHNDRGEPCFKGFVESFGRYFESLEPLTIREFKAIAVSEVLAQADAGGRP